MTADHAGQTGGERGCGGCGMRPPVPHSWWCPIENTPVDGGDAIGMALGRIKASRPVPVPGQADERGRVGCDCGAGVSSCAPGCSCDSCDRMRGRAGQPLGAPLGEVTVGQAAREEFTPAPQNVKSGPENSRGREQAREAAVEAALLADSPLYNGVIFGVDPSKRAEFWQRVAEVAVAALSAAPGQGQGR